MTDPEALWADLVAFISRETGVPSAELRPQTTLFGDLGVDSDDADELFLDFAKRFHVDLAGLELRRHFGSEGFTLLQLLLFPVSLLRHFLPGEIHQKAGLEPITLADLHRSAMARRWVGSADSAPTAGGF